MNDDLQRAVGRLEGEMRAIRKAQSVGNAKLDTLITQTATIKAERQLEQRKYQKLTLMLSAVGTFAGALIAKLSGHI